MQQLTIRGAKQGLLVVLVCSAFAFSGLAVTSLHDPGQGMYADIAAAMAATGDWVTPRFNGVPYFNKPPLFFWLTALAMSLLGSWDWVARLWSALPVVLTALVIWRLGERIYGGNAGVLAGIIFGSNVAVLLYARVPSTDFLLVLWVTLALYAVAEIVHEPARRWYVLLFYGSAGLGILTKGLIGLILPAVIVAAFGLALCVRQGMAPEERHRVFTGLRAVLFGRSACAGWLLLLCLVLPWHVIAELRHPGVFDYYVMDHQFGRFFGTRTFVEDDIPSDTLSFLAVTLLLFFPWSVFLPAAVGKGLPQRNGCSGTTLRLMVGLWAALTLVFFCSSQSKLEHYALPAFPALSLLVGAAWSAALEPARARSALQWTLGAACVAFGLCGLALMTFADRMGPRFWFAGLAGIDVYYRVLKDAGSSFPFASAAPFIEFARGIGVVLLLGFPLAALAFVLRRPRASFACIVASAGVIFLLGYRLAPVFEVQQSAKPVSLALRDRLAPADRIVHEGLLEYGSGLPFYTERPILVLNGRRGILEFGSRFPEARPVFIDTEAFLEMWRGRGRIFLVTRFPPRHSAVRYLSRDELRVLGRFGAKWLYSNQASES